MTFYRVFKNASVQRFILLACLVLLWQWLSSTERISSLFFPAPSTILSTLYELILSGLLWQHLSATMLRVLFGLMLGGIPAILLGIFMGWSPFYRTLIDPVISAFHPMPKVALLPLIMIIFGIGELSKVVAVAIGAFFPLMINSMAGVAQIQPIYFEAAKVFKADRMFTLRRIIIPGSSPLILAGFRLALNSSVLITIAVELVTARKGLGALIWLAWELFQTEKLYAGLLVIGLLGIAANSLIRLLQERLVPWQPTKAGG